MANFEYDVVNLIELVKSKPCLWDNTNENCNNKIIQDKNWQEILTNLDEMYEKRTLEEREKREYKIRTEWENIRDSFIRCLGSKHQQGAKETYTGAYDEHLHFLKKLAENVDSESRCSQVNSQESEGNEFKQGLQSPQPTATIASNSPSQAQPIALTLKDHLPPYNTDTESKKRKLNGIEQEIQMKPKNKKPSAEPRFEIPLQLSAQTHHKRFLLSFLPLLQDMSVRELLDFQTQTELTIQAIKQRRALNPFFPNVPSPPQLLPPPYMSAYQGPPNFFVNQLPPPLSPMPYRRRRPSNKLPRK